MTGALVLYCQKAPSAKRCIKTEGVHALTDQLDERQKAPSAKRCIKTYGQRLHVTALVESESTERQKVH